MGFFLRQHFCVGQTELLPHCGDVPPVGQVMQENGKLLLLAVLEVSDRTLMSFLRPIHLENNIDIATLVPLLSLRFL